MLKLLFRNQFLSILRGKSLKKNLLELSLKSLAFFFIAIYLIALGVFAGIIIKKVSPGENPIDVFNSFLIFYFFVEISARILLQKVQGMILKPYLIQPIPKRKLINALLVYSIYQPLNFLHLFIVIPFSIMYVGQEFGLLSTLSWIIGIFILVQVINLMIVYLSRFSEKRPLISTFVFIFIATIVLLSYLFNFPILEYSNSIFGSLLVNPVTILFPIGLFIAVYFLNVNVLSSEFYLKENKIRKSFVEDKLSRFNLGDRGSALKYFEVELKLLLRHKRSRKIFFFSIFMILYLYFMLLSSESKMFKGNVGLLMMTLLFSGFLSMNYGQFLFSWESNYFDGILSNYSSLKEYIRSKYNTLIGGVVLANVFLIPLVIIRPETLFVIIISVIYNIGINTFWILFIGTFNKKRMEMEASLYSYNAKGGVQFISVFPIFGIPIFLYVLVSLLASEQFALYCLLIIGALGILSKSFFLNFIYSRFEKKKYEMAEGFRVN